MLFDTHNHFDFKVFNQQRTILAKKAYYKGVHSMLIAGYRAKEFANLNTVKTAINTEDNTPNTYIAFGLHPGFVAEHSHKDLALLEYHVAQRHCVALGEIGLDTFTKDLKTTLDQQQYFFQEQLKIAETYQLPVILHIRKAHAQAIKILRQAHFKQGGIAHSFSGGVQEAKALIQLGFKIGVTGQVCNPQAKKLRTVIQTLGSQHLVIETDCPDMMPMPIHQRDRTVDNINTPANLTYVFDELQTLLQEDREVLQQTLWKNSLEVLHLDESNMFE